MSNNTEQQSVEEVMKKNFIAAAMRIDNVSEKEAEAYWISIKDEDGDMLAVCYAAMQDYASQFQSSRSKGVGMQWVKASDKCPLELNTSNTSKVKGNLILRIDGVHPATGYFSSSQGIIYCYYEGRYFPNESRAGSFMSNEFDRIEYLSESAPPFR